MSYDLYDDDRRYDGDNYGAGGSLGYRDAYDSGLDALNPGGSFADDIALNGLNNLSLNTDLDGYNSYGSGLASGSGLYDDPLALDSDVGLNDPGLGGYMGGGALDAFDTLGSGGTGLYDSYDSGLGGYEGSRSLDAGLSGLDALGGAGLGTYDTLGSGLSSLDTYGSLDSGLDATGLQGSYDAGLPAGLGGLESYDSLNSLGGGLDSLNSYGSELDSFGISGLDYAGAGESLGWNTYDSGFDNLGLGGLNLLGASDYVEDAALLAGGAALGAGAAALYNSRSHHGDNYGLSGSSGLYGDTLYDRDLGVYGHSSLGYGAYSGFNSGLYDQTMAYSDLANYQNSLYANTALNDLERDRLLQDRYAFDALDDAARRSAWQSYSPGHRSRLGLDTGYWGSTYGNSYYDPQYSAWGYGASFSSNPGYYGSDYSYGYGDPSFYSTALTTPSWGLSSSLRARYSPYYSSTSSIDTLPYWTDDLRFREAADLSYYQQKLQSDRNLQDAERMMLWRQRQEWQALDEESRRLRWMEMDEMTRERLGLGQVGSWYGNYLGASGVGASLPYELPSSLRSVYSPYMSSSYRSSDYLDPTYARYQDLLAWSNALKYDRKLREADKQARWRQRLEFEMLDDAARRARYQQMPYTQRSLLGLSGGYWDSRLSFSNLFTPSNLRPMRYPVSTTLSRVYKPYQSKNTLSRALKEGVESALAFADLVAFENALRSDRRLREQDKLRRWKARVRWQEMSEMERRMRFYRMQESERRNIGLGLSSFFGRRYSAPIALNGTRGLNPPRTAMPMLRQALPSPLRARYQPVLARQPNLATSNISRSLVGPDKAKDLADRIKLSIAQKVEQMPGLSMDQRLASTEQKRQILRSMDNDRRTAAALQVSEQERLNRLRRMGY